jgi:hypothetical protein
MIVSLPETGEVKLLLHQMTIKNGMDFLQQIRVRIPPGSWATTPGAG